MVGAAGGVGCTVALGLSALGRGLVPPTGLVTELAELRVADLAPIDAIVLGGHEVRQTTLLDGVEGFRKRSGLFTSELVRACARDLASVDRNLRPGTLLGASRAMRGVVGKPWVREDKSCAAAIERLADDIVEFRRDHKLSDVVVIHAASSEPPIRPRAEHRSDAALSRALIRSAGPSLPPSCIYALAALEAGCPFVNFTPSAGITLPAIQERARRRGLPYMGSDGKTGETLVKSVLAPLFAARHLRVLSWVGQNILGNQDGRVLSDPATKQSKLRSKDRLLRSILPGEPMTGVGIEFVPSLDDWKVAWDFIHFEGFLGTRMHMQFIWHGSDSALAAPLIIDLARLAALEHRRGGVGPMSHLAFYFKDPLGATEHDLPTQWRTLVEHVQSGRCLR